MSGRMLATYLGPIVSPVPGSPVYCFCVVFHSTPLTTLSLSGSTSSSIYRTKSPSPTRRSTRFAEEKRRAEPAVSCDAVLSKTMTSKEQAPVSAEQVTVSLKVFHPDYPPTTCPFPSFEYFQLTLKRRNCVGMREIGTQHTFLDVFLCATLCTPGVLYLSLPNPDPLPLRIAVLVECLIVTVVSVIADGFLLHQSADESNREGLLWIDRKTAVLHMLTVPLIVIYRLTSGYITLTQFLLPLAFSTLAIAAFHRRVYCTFVEQDWRKARFWGRVWHVGGSLAPVLAFIPS